MNTSNSNQVTRGVGQRRAILDLAVAVPPPSRQHTGPPRPCPEASAQRRHEALHPQASSAPSHEDVQVVGTRRSHAVDICHALSKMWRCWVFMAANRLPRLDPRLGLVRPTSEHGAPTTSSWGADMGSSAHVAFEPRHPRATVEEHEPIHLGHAMPHPTSAPRRGQTLDIDVLSLHSRR